MKAERLKDRVIVVTGGAQGMGRAMATGFLDEGARVAVVDIAADALEAAKARADAAYGPDRLLGLQADVCRPEDCERVVDAVLARFGAVHALVNNAGRGMTAIRSDYLDRPVPFWEVDVQRWQALMDLNVRAPFLLVKAVAPHLLAQRWGRIVNVTTSLDTMVRSAYTPYGPSKAWLEAATVGWSRDLQGSGVTCNALIPGGAVNTAFFDRDAPLVRETLIQPDVMVAPACWLVSDDSAAVTGQRYVARLWDRALPDAEAARNAGAPAAWQTMGAQSLWPGAKPVD